MTLRSVCLLECFALSPLWPEVQGRRPQAPQHACTQCRGSQPVGYGQVGAGGGRRGLPVAAPSDGARRHRGLGGRYLSRCAGSNMRRAAILVDPARDTRNLCLDPSAVRLQLARASARTPADDGTEAKTPVWVLAPHTPFTPSGSSGPSRPSSHVASTHSVVASASQRSETPR